MQFRLTVAVLVAFLLCSLVLAQDGVVTILTHLEETFINNDCKKNQTCDLKKVEYFVEDYSVGIDGDYNYGTRFFARYETKRTKDLEKYVFVQFIKGCDFSSRSTDGKVEIYHDIVYPRVTGTVKFNFPDWTIDSYDFDPVYSTVPGESSRFYGFRWNTVPGSFSTRTEKYYGQKKPKKPQLYIVDHPGSAFYSNGIAHNISLKFRTCIYRIKDVPLAASHGNINFEEPLSCYEWSSSFVYDHSAGQFENLSEISSACSNK